MSGGLSSTESTRSGRRRAATAWRFDLATAPGGRAEQQDRAELLSIPGHPDDHLLVLADGMGGRQHGALAAQAVIDTARRELKGLNRDNPHVGLTALCHAANEAVHRLGREHGSAPGSTCTALYLRHDEAYWIHVGDSRLYHFNDDRLLYCTDDHTLGALLHRDQTSPAALNPDTGRDNRLYMCLGGSNELEPQSGATAVGADDWFLLCSDGFWTQVTAEEAALSVTTAPTGARPAVDLVTLAQRRGGRDGDNVSLALAIPRCQAPRRAWWQLWPGRRTDSRR